MIDLTISKDGPFLASCQVSDIEINMPGIGSDLEQQMTGDEVLIIFLITTTIKKLLEYFMASVISGYPAKELVGYSTFYTAQPNRSDGQLDIVFSLY